MSEDSSSPQKSVINSDDLTQILNIFKSQNTKQNLSDTLKISITLNSQNYALWARMIRVAIGGKSKSLLDHLSSNSPETTEEKYEQWEQNDLVVFSWLIQNIEPSLASNLTEFPTAKSLWDALVVTYSSGKDKLQLFDLHVKANEIKQNGMSLKDIWIVLQGIWGEIERRDPNPMKCSTDISIYNRIRAEQKLFQFLNALDRRYDSIKREILRCDPLPSSEAAYATVRKDTAHQKILGATSDTTAPQGIATGLVVNPPGESEGTSLVSKGQCRPYKQPEKQDKSHLKCEHCGKTRHTKEQCFKLVGYPEWWIDGSKKGNVTTTNNRGGNSSSSSATATNNNGGNTGFGGFMAETTGNPIGGADLAVHPYIGECYNVHNINNKQKTWILDSGATDTMTFEQTDLISNTTPTKTHVKTANGGVVPVEGGGMVEITPNLKISNSLYVPSLSHKLLSISHVSKELNCIVLMYPSFCILQDIRTGVIIGRGTECQGLYYVDEVNQHGTVMLTHGTTERQAWLWHRRLGHPSTSYMHLLLPQFSLSKNELQCETCVLAKSHRQTYKPSNTRVEFPFSLIHSDVWGPAKVLGGQDFKYFLLFVDDCTRMIWIYFLKHKSEVPEKFANFHTMIQTQFQKPIQILRSDNGGEFVNTTMKLFCQDKGIIHQTTNPNTPEQNGVAERKNRIILEITRALIIDSQVPTSFWPEAVATAAYLINRLPTKALELKTPLQTLSEFTKIPPALTLQPRIFGCSVFVHIPKTERSKLDPCAEKCVFVGYGVNQKGYRCYNPRRRHIFTTMNCDFLETEFFYKSQLRSQGEMENEDTLSWLNQVPSSEEVNHSLNDESLSNIVPSIGVSVTNQHPPNLMSEVSNSHNSDTESSNHDETPNPLLSHNHNETATEHVESIQEELTERYVLPPRENRGIPPQRYSPEKVPRKSRYPVANIAKGRLTDEAKSFVSSVYSEQIPTTVQQAFTSKNWTEAMKTEMMALKKADTWDKCILPVEKKAVGARWVFTVKYNADGTVNRHKARLVAKGYTQTYGIDYSDTFSPVAKIDTIRVLFSVAANKDWPLHQFDVKNAFLHGDLKEEVYMVPPPGFSEDFKKDEVCKLKKSLYGLKQSPRAWFGRFTMAMKRYGYKQSNADHTLFLKKRGNLITCLIIYVDDMIITGDDTEEISHLRNNLFTEFEMKDLGRLKYFLGIEVLRSNGGIFISQRKYVLDLLAETGMLDCKPNNTPIIVNHKLKIVEGAKLADREKYQRLVGKLIYLAHTRPDIAYAVGVVSQFMHEPQTHHMEAVMRIVRYLKGSPGKGVVFKRNGHLQIEAFTDADWAGNQVNRRSTAGYFTFVGGNLVTWRSKKQKVVALSSAEAEFRGIVKGIAEILWLRKLMDEIGFPLKTPTKLFCDNEAAISISENPVQHDRTKHVEVDRHFIKEKIENRIVELPSIRSEDQLADILTKAVTGMIFESVLRKLSIEDPTAQLEGEC